MGHSPTFESATDDPDEFTGSVSTIVPGVEVAAHGARGFDDWWPSLRPGESTRDDRRKLRHVEEWIAENLDQRISRAVLCEVGGLDVRALSRAFRRRHDMGPMQYVRARRLEAVNRALVGAERGEITVTDLAMTYGFHHLSRFADDYRRAFGELPSDTLSR